MVDDRRRGDFAAQEYPLRASAKTTTRIIEAFGDEIGNSNRLLSLSNITQIKPKQMKTTIVQLPTHGSGLSHSCSDQLSPHSLSRTPHDLTYDSSMTPFYKIPPSTHRSTQQAHTRNHQTQHAIIEKQFTEPKRSVSLTGRILLTNDTGSHKDDYLQHPI